MRVRRMFLAFTAAVMMVAVVTLAGPVFAQGGHTNCKAFGQNIAGLATGLGGAFGQTAAASAPLNDTVDVEQAALCEPKQ